ncbi:hypothetical protein MNBD_GAMMA03-626 [hydrothermal vent metagenome]|uniref:Uncharacterized protein n=1 Tax=hydrothermal vent metagenome TaxID=652676 RepID=A0A3B0WWM6_9ZZZZ
MNKFMFLLVGIMSYGYAKDFSEQMIMIEPVSWDDINGHMLSQWQDH